jgi:hypothetical protein
MIGKKLDYTYRNPCVLVTDYDNRRSFVMTGLVMIERFEDRKQWINYESILSDDDIMVSWLLSGLESA